MRSKPGAVFAGLLACCVAGLPSPARAAKYHIRWLLAHKNLDYFEEAAVQFKQDVESGSRGDISVQIVTLDQDGGVGPDGKRVPQIANKVAAGEAEMGHSYTDVAGDVDHELWAFEAPFLFRDYRHLEGVFEGPLNDELLGRMRSSDIVGLSFTYSGGASGLASVSRAIRRPEDLKGLRVAAYPDGVSTAWLTSLGAVPVPLEHAQEDALVGLAQSGKVDAAVMTWRNFEQARLNRVFRRMSMMNSTYLVSVTYVNRKFYEGLPPRYQKLLVDASHQAGRVERARTIELNERARQEMLAKGVEEARLNAAETALFKKALAPAYRDTIAALVGGPLLDKIRRTADFSQPAVLAPAVARR